MISLAVLGSARRFRLESSSIPVTAARYAPAGSSPVTGIRVGRGVGVAGGPGVAASSGCTVGRAGWALPVRMSSMPG